MPHGEDRGGHGGLGRGRELGGGQGGGHARVLHADLDRGSARSLLAAAPQAPGQVAEEVAEQVVADDDSDDDRSGGDDHGDGLGDDDQQHVADAEDGDPRQRGQDPLDQGVGEVAHQEAPEDGREHHEQDVHGHRAAIDLHAGADQPRGEHGRHERRQQRRDRRHGHGQGHIGLRQVGDDVRGGAAGGAAHQYDADRDGVGQAEHPGEAEAHQGHDDVLGGDAYQYGQRPGDDQGEVGQREGQAHAEHDHAQGPVDARGERQEGRGEHHGGDEGRDDDEGEDRDRDARAAVLAAHRGGDGWGLRRIVCWGHATILLRSAAIYPRVSPGEGTSIPSHSASR